MSQQLQPKRVESVLRCEHPHSAILGVAYKWTDYPTLREEPLPDQCYFTAESAASKIERSFLLYINVIGYLRLQL